MPISRRVTIASLQALRIDHVSESQGQFSGLGFSEGAELSPQCQDAGAGPCHVSVGRPALAPGAEPRTRGKLAGAKRQTTRSTTQVCSGRPSLSEPLEVSDRGSSFTY